MSCSCTAKRDPASLDDFLPPILIRFEDEFGNNVPVPSNLTVNDFTVSMNDNIAAKFMVK